MDVIRLGAASPGRIPERWEPGLELAESGLIDYLVFDCLSEKDILECQLRRSRGEVGYALYLEEAITKFLPACARNRVKIISNMGAADPRAAMQKIVDICRRLNLNHLKVGCVVGDDVLPLIRKIPDLRTSEENELVSGFWDGLIAANAYLDVQAVVEALRQGADIIVTGRIGDSSMYLGPMIYSFGWRSDDWDLLAKGMTIGHLMECCGHVTGGYFADPGYKDVPDLHRLGFPIAEVYLNGDGIITKVPGSGGCVTEATCKEQLVYEIGDPSSYIHADVVVDLTGTTVEQVARDRVKVSGSRGRPRPEKLKVCLGILEGYVGVGRIIYGGPGAYERACLAAETVLKRLELTGIPTTNIDISYIGMNSLFAPWAKRSPIVPNEVALRVAGRFKDRESAAKIPFEVDTLSCHGPAGGSCGRRTEAGCIDEIVGHRSTLIPRELVQSQTIVRRVYQ